MRNQVAAGVSLVLCFFGIAAAQEVHETTVDLSSDANTERTMEQGRRIFRFDTFGDESFWGDTLGLHKAVEGAKLGGVGRKRESRDRARRGLESGRRCTAARGDRSVESRRRRPEQPGNYAGLAQVELPCRRHWVFQ